VKAIPSRSGVKLFAGYNMRCQSERHTKNNNKGDSVGSVSIGYKIPVAVTWAFWDGWGDNSSHDNGNPNLF
jgi:hypothetical protein